MSFWRLCRRLSIDVKRMKYVHYRSVGNTVGIDPNVEDYWEIDLDCYVTRSITILSDGARLKYDLINDADELGALPEGKITSDMLFDTSFGIATFISLAEFEAAWALTSEL